MGGEKVKIIINYNNYFSNFVVIFVKIERKTK
jgi:hypothetical protein